MPNRQYYGSAPNAFAGGRLFGQDQRRRQHQENALNELIERFGPEAGDPTAWSQVQGIDHDAQRFPHELERLKHENKMRPYALSAAQRGDAAGQALVEQYGVRAGDTAAWSQAQAIGHNDAMFPHRLDEMERATAAFNANVDNFGPAAGNPAAHGIEQEELERLRGAALNAARALQTTKARGGDLGAAFDKAMDLLQKLGLPADAIAGFREQVVSDPDFVDEFVAMLSDPDREVSNRPLSAGFDERGPDGNPRRIIVQADGTGRVLTDETGRPFMPIVPEQRDRVIDQGDERLKQGWTRLTLDEAKMRFPAAQAGVQYWEDPDGRVVADVVPGSPQDRQAQTEEREIDAAARRTIRVNSGLLTAANTVQRDGRRTLARLGADITPEHGERLPRELGWLPQMSLYRALSSKVWGTQARRMERNIQSVMDNIGIDKLLEIKDAGSGLGHVPHQQMVQLQSVLGRLNDLDRPIPELIQDMEEALDRYDEIIGLAQREIAEAEETLGRPRGQTYAPTPRPSPSGGAVPGGGQPAPAGGGDWQSRARQLESEGRSQQEITQILRQEGLIAGGGR